MILNKNLCNLAGFLNVWKLIFMVDYMKVYTKVKREKLSIYKIAQI